MNEELKLIISAEVSKLKQGVDNAKKHMNDFKGRVKEASKDVEAKFASIGESMKTAASNIGVGVAAAGGALLALAGSTEEYRNQQAQLITAFEESGSSAETAKNVYNDLYRVLGDTGQAQEAAQHLAKLTNDQKALSEWTTISQGVYSQFGASLPIESLLEAANETAKVGTVTGALADSLNWAALENEMFGLSYQEMIPFVQLSKEEYKALTEEQKKQYDIQKAEVDAIIDWNNELANAVSAEDRFNLALQACNTEAEREKLIRETLSGVYSDAAATYEENNRQILAQRDAQAALQEKLAALGEALAPVITAFTSFASDALALVVPHIQSLAEQYLPLLQEVLGIVAETMGKAFQLIADNIGTIGTIAGIIGGIAAAIGLYNTVAAVKAAMDAAQVTTLAGLVAAYAAQAAAMIVAIAPYALIVAAIAGLIAIIVVCVKHWDEIKEKIKEVSEAIKKWAVEAVDSIKQKFEEMKQKLTEIFNAVKDAIGNAMGAAKEVISEKLGNIKQAYEENGGGIKGIVSGYMEAVKGFWTAGLSFIDNLTGGKLTNIANIMRDKLNTAKETVSNILQDIKDKFSSIMDSVKSAVTEGIEKIKNAFDFDWSLPKISLPKFSVSGGKAPWGFGGKGSLPKVSVKWNALGGVFDNPTIFRYGDTLQGIGEDGAEAIVPLEKNTQWMDKLASMLSEKMGINQPIVLQVDGKTFAQISVDSINQLTRQRGAIPLNII